jgi:hypothetical protein
MPLALDPPAKPRKVKKAGWHRARRVGAITVQRRASLPVPPCNACGVIPSVSGMCRCS